MKAAAFARISAELARHCALSLDEAAERIRRTFPASNPPEISPLDRPSIYESLLFTPEDRKRADALDDRTFREWVRLAESREHFLEWLAVYEQLAQAPSIV